MMTKVKTGNSSKEQSEKLSKEQLLEINQELVSKVQILSDLQNLQDEAYYRRQNLVLLERIALALETSLKEEENK